MKKSMSLFAMVMLALGVQANILDLDFSGVDGTEDYDEATFEVTAMDSVDANLNLVEGLNFKLPSNVNGTGGAAYGTSYDLNVFGFGGNTDSLGNYIAGNRYMSITIQADAGYLLNLDGATVSLLGSRNGGGAPDTFYITATTTGTTDTSNQIGASTSLPLTGQANVYDIQATFSGTEWNGLTGAVEIRFYGGGNSITGNIHFSDLSITGGSIVAISDPPPAIAFFSADPSSVFSNATFTLSWDTLFDDTLTLNPGSIDVTGLSSTNLQITVDTAYELIAINTFGSATNDVLVTVITTDPVINSFATSSTNVLFGETVNLSWNVDNTVTLDLNGSDVTGLDSTHVIVTADTLYTLTATSPVGTDSTALTVTVNPIEPTINAFTARPVDIVPGAMATLSWDVAGAESLVIDPGGIVVTGLTSTQLVVNTETTYTLTAANAYGDTNTTATVYILVPGDSTAISINLTNGTENEQLATNTLAGLSSYVYPQWNTVSNDAVTASYAGTVSSLVDSDGVTTACSITWTNSGDYNDFSAFTDANAGIGDAQVAHGYLTDTSVDPLTITVENHGYSEYDVVVYFAANSDGDAPYAPVTVNGTEDQTVGGRTYYSTAPSWEENDSLVFANQTAATMTLVTHRTGDPLERAQIAGIQIVNRAYSPDGPVEDLVIAGPFAGGMELKWTGKDGKTYGVETNSNLIIPSGWTQDGSDHTGNGSMIIITNPIGPDPLFYRVRSK